MQNLKFREEFLENKLKSTMFDFSNRQGTSALNLIAEELFKFPSGESILLSNAETLLKREIRHRGKAKDDTAYSSKLIGWVVVIE